MKATGWPTIVGLNLYAIISSPNLKEQKHTAISRAGQS